MKAYQNYIFDLYGTLVDIHTDEGKPSFWKTMAAYFETRGAVYQARELQTAYLALVQEKESELKDRLDHTRGADSHESSPEIHLEDVFLQLYRARGVPPTDALIRDTALEFRRLSTTHLRAYAGASQLLTAIREAGRAAYLLSNAQHIFTEWEMRTLGLWTLFDGIFISSDHGCRKPDPRFFRGLLEAYALSPSQCLMIGNDPVNDIAGAAAVGMDTYYIRSSLSPRGEGEVHATYRQDAMDLKKLRRSLAL
ncbi:MAG: HAD family hydrolase [Lachnospiraceae bacterium]|nr:HAD family hydrolase [Lachnospiraceae bacterium]